MSHIDLSKLESPKPETLAIATDELAHVFPFYFSFGADWRILTCGTSLAKLLSREPHGADLRHAFELVSPHSGWNFPRWKSCRSEAFVFRIPGTEVVLRGQLCFSSLDETLIFVGSPWAPDTDCLHALGLAVSDFAPHDATLDHLFIVQANRRAVLEVQQTLDRLSEEKRERIRLEEIECALEHDLNASGDLRVRIDAASRIIEVKSARSAYGIGAPQEALGKPLCEVLPHLAERIEPLLAQEREDPWAFDAGLGPEGGSPFLSFRMMRTLAGETLILGHDVTDRRELEEELRNRALHDPLTGLANRTLLAEQVDLARSRANSGRHPGVIALMILDLDDFKAINDSHGHSTGDRLLQKISRRISRSLRTSDVCARLGGDEFAVLLTDMGQADQSWEVAERILQNVARPVHVEGVEIRTQASIGIVIGGGDESRDQFFRNADLALYRAKARGKGIAELFDSELQDRAVRRATLKRDIARGIDQEEFLLEYQPVVELDTSILSGVEALARWHHPELGLVSPFEFIEIAEESGAIKPLGRYIINQALAQKGIWDRLLGDRSMDLAVNLSRKQLVDDELVETIVQSLEINGVDATSVTFEITEGLVMRDREQSLHVLDKLKALGARIAMDDFGRDYSSLSELETLPIDVLKVDKIFVDRLLEGSSWPVPESIVHLGQQLGLTVIAEGIEEKCQLDALREMRCPLGQGYYFARPESPEAISARIRACPSGPLRIEGAKPE